MAKYQITAPDGTKYQITAPDSAPQADVLAYAQSQHVGPNSAPAASPAPQQPSLDQNIQGSSVGRFLHGAMEPVMGGIQSIAHLVGSLPGADQSSISSLDQGLQQGEKAYQDNRAATGSSGTDIARLLGNLASPVNFVVPEAAGVARMGMLGRAGASALGGAALGAAQPVLDNSQSYASQKSTQAGLGALGGVLAPAIGSAVGKVVSPANLSPHVRALLGEGLPLTIGQTLGGGVKALEDKLTSIPLLGGIVRTAQGRATQALNRTAINRALAPIGQTLPGSIPVGRAAIDHVATKLGDAYDKVLPQLNLTADHQFIGDVRQAISDAKQTLPDPQYERFKTIVQNQILGKADQANAYNGETLQGIHSELGRISGGLGSDPSFDQRELGDAVNSIHTAFRDAISRQNPNHAPQLKAIDQGYANFARLRKAAGGIGAKDGVFSAPQLSSAVRAEDKSVAKGAYARGNALMQDLSDPATAVLPSSVPDSGTTGRGMVGALLLDGAAHISPMAAIPALAGTAIYSRPGQAILRGLASRGGSPALGAAARRAGLFGSGPLAAYLADQSK